MRTIARISKRALQFVIAGLAVSLVLAGALAPQRALGAEGSLFDEQLTWTDENGAPFSLSSFRGHRVILTLAYTNCTTACPLTLGRLHRIDALLKERGSTIPIVIVSLDSKRDTPAARAHFRGMHKLGENWHVLGGRPENVRALAVMLNYSYRADPASGEIIHSNKIVALDRDGSILAAVDGLDSSLEGIINIASK